MIIDFEVPLQSQDSVSNITSPESWTYNILTSAEFESQFGVANPFGSAYILHWYDTVAVNTDPPASWQKSIVPTGFSAYYNSDVYTADVYEDWALFGFDSLSGPVDGPYESSWSDSGRKPGDPPLPLQHGAVTGSGLPPYMPASPFIGTRTRHVFPPRRRTRGAGREPAARPQGVAVFTTLRSTMAR
jgi:hypothetical protein